MQELQQNWPSSTHGVGEALPKAFAQGVSLFRTPFATMVGAWCRPPGRTPARPSRQVALSKAGADEPPKYSDRAAAGDLRITTHGTIRASPVPQHALGVTSRRAGLRAVALTARRNQSKHNQKATALSILYLEAHPYPGYGTKQLAVCAAKRILMNHQVAHLSKVRPPPPSVSKRGERPAICSICLWLIYYWRRDDFKMSRAFRCGIHWAPFGNRYSTRLFIVP